MKTIIKWILKVVAAIISLPLWIVSGALILVGVIFALLALYITNFENANIIIKELYAKLKK